MTSSDPSLRLGIEVLHDPDERTAVVIQLFETADDVAPAETHRRDGPGGDYDQAHMIGGFQQLTGQSPAACAALNLADGGGVIGD